MSRKPFLVAISDYQDFPKIKFYTKLYLPATRSGDLERRFRNPDFIIGEEALNDTWGSKTELKTQRMLPDMYRVKSTGLIFYGTADEALNAAEIHVTEHLKKMPNLCPVFTEMSLMDHTEAGFIAYVSFQLIPWKNPEKLYRPVVAIPEEIFSYYLNAENFKTKDEGLNNLKLFDKKLKLLIVENGFYWLTEENSEGYKYEYEAVWVAKDALTRNFADVSDPDFVDKTGSIRFLDI